MFFSSEVQDVSGRSVLILTFEDHKTRNSFSLAAARELKGRLDLLTASPSADGVHSISGLIFRARGRVFCAGGNLADYAAMSNPEQGQFVNREITLVLEQLSQLPIPTICWVEGDCFGGGLELLSAFDWVLANPGLIFGFWQRRIGLSFGWGGGVRLQRRMGTPALLQNALAARNLYSVEARQTGLVDHVSLAACGLETALTKMAEFTRFAQTPVGALKSWQLAPTAPAESAMFERLWWNPEHQRALKRFQPG